MLLFSSCLSKGSYLLTCLVTLDPVNTTSEKFQNAALILQLGLPYTPIRHENGALHKRSSNRRNLKRMALRLSVEGNILKTKLFKNDDVTIIIWFPCLRFPERQIQNDRWLLRFQFTWRRLNVSRVKTPSSNSPAYSVDEGIVWNLQLWRHAMVKYTRHPCTHSDGTPDVFIFKLNPKERPGSDKIILFSGLFAAAVCWCVFWPVL